MTHLSYKKAGKNDGFDFLFEIVSIPCGCKWRNIFKSKIFAVDFGSFKNDPGFVGGAWLFTLLRTIRYP